jgi:hypothetical protein
MPTFRPERAFLHPVWIASLVLLALNDHVLKGSGLLPGWLTGKLSDFSGLMVAPVVLAAILRARGHRMFLVSHVVVGIGFALLEISPTLVAAVESALPGVRMWPDLTDLAALVMLPVSYALFSPRARGEARPRALHALAGLVGLVFCTATSYQPPAFPESGSSFENTVYLHNGSTGTMYVSVSAVTDGTIVDCGRLRYDSSYASDLPFEHVGYWTLESGRNMPLVLRETPHAGCVALAMNNHVVAFSPYDLPVVRVPFAGRAPSAGEIYWDGQRLLTGPNVYADEL